MPKKPKFKPKIKKVKLNPEQAVLACNCYDTGKVEGWAVSESTNMCWDTSIKSKGTYTAWNSGESIS